MSDADRTPAPLKHDPLKAAFEAEAAMGAAREAEFGENPAAGLKSEPPRNKREAIVDALMALAAERRFEDITMTEIAGRAGVTLADFRDHFPSKGAILAAYSRTIDRQVLDETSQDLIAEPAKERLFDVLMRRLDAMAPHREGLRGIWQWAKRDPLSAAALNQVALNSMRFMLEAADISSEGMAGTIKLQGLVLAWARVLDVWFDDEDPALARTMAALDRELTRGETLVSRVNDMNRLFAPLNNLARNFLDARRRPRRRDEWRDDDLGPSSYEERRTHTL